MDNDGNSAPSTSPSLELCFLAIDNNKNRFGPMFPIDIPSHTLVGRLNGAVKAHVSPELDHIPTHRLFLWMLINSLSSGDNKASRTEFEQKINEINLPDPESNDALEGNGIVQLLNPVAPLSKYWSKPPERGLLHIIVQVPSFKRRRVEESSSGSGLSFNEGLYYTPGEVR